LRGILQGRIGQINRKTGIVRKPLNDPLPVSNATRMFVMF